MKVVMESASPKSVNIIISRTSLRERTRAVYHEEPQTDVRSIGGRRVEGGVLGEVGYAGLKVCPQVYHCLEMDTMAAIHGDDIIAEGEPEKMDRLEPAKAQGKKMLQKELPMMLTRGAMESMSRSNTFARTFSRPPLHTRAATDSNDQLLRPNTPAVAQAARWWPMASSGRQHRQLRTDRGRGRRSLRSKSARKGLGSNLDVRSTGKLTKGVLASGPL